MNKRPRETGAARVAVVAFMAAAVLFSVLISAGCESGLEKKERRYKAGYAELVEEFERQVAGDDVKAQRLVEKEDLPGVVTLVKARMSNIDKVLAELLELYPPAELRKLHVLTGFYLVALKDRLEAQNALYSALLEGRPTTDLATVQDGLIARSQAVAQELGIELQKAGIVIDIEQSQDSEEPASSAPGDTGRE